MHNMTIEILKAAKEFKQQFGAGDLTKWEELLSNRAAETAIEYLAQKEVMLHHYFYAIKRIKELEKEIIKLNELIKCDL